MQSLRTYMAMLTLYENNFRILHWKLAGAEFHKTHERFGAYYDQLGTFMDETAEQMITLGETPVSSRDALSILQGETGFTAVMIDPALDYSADAANHAAYHMFEQLREMAVELADADDDELPIEVSDVFMDHARWYRIEGMYKLQRANTTATKPNDQPEPAPVNVPDV